MDAERFLCLLEKYSALIRDSHVVYTSGMHGRSYINKDAIYPHPQVVSDLCKALAAHFAPVRPSVVAAPAIGGVILAQWVAYHLCNVSGASVLALYAEKGSSAGFDFRRGYAPMLAAARVLVLEDIVTTGGSVSAVVKAARACGGEIVGVGALCNRGAVTAAQVGSPPEFFSLFELSLESWPMESCPLCAEGVPINTTVGKGREFMMRDPVGRHQS